MRRFILFAALFVAAIAWAPSARAVLPDEMLADPALEARARDISQDLRCLVCQNQSIDDSNAPLARDLRLLVRERLKAGDSDQAVVDYVTARYGDFARLKPPFQPNTWLLWLGPLAVAALGAAGVAWRLRRRGAAPDDAAPPPLSAEERQTLARLLEPKD
ncbi:MAG: cytochrome c-type biogenesis protein [Rhodospirillaceae bacterium]